VVKKAYKDLKLSTKRSRRLAERRKKERVRNFSKAAVKHQNPKNGPLNDGRRRQQNS
jgi:hypothetical protein